MALVEESKEQVSLYPFPLLGWYFGKAGFPLNQVRSGYFECIFNLWAMAER
jgi:hypothetical protein